MRILPFRLMPGSWGLVGDAYLEAKAYYECEGEELARRLLELRVTSNAELQRKALDIDLQYKRLTPYRYDQLVAQSEFTGTDLGLRLIDIEIEYGELSAYEGGKQKVELLHEAGIERDLALLNVELEFNCITKNAYDKACATLRNEPWVAIINSGFDPDQGIDGVFFEFDWNQQWIEFLRLNGYIGHTDEQIVDDWFSDVCRSYTNVEMNVPFPKDLGILP